MRQAIKRCADGIKGVSTSKRLGNNVMGAHQLNYGAYGTPGDDAGSVNRRFKQDVFSAEQAVNLMRDGSTLERNVDQMLFSLLNRFRDGHRNFGRFSFADSHPTVSVANHYQGAKIKALATLYYFGDTVDENDLVFETEFIRINSHAVSSLFPFPPFRGTYGLTVLKLKASFTRRFGKSLNATVVHAPASIKYYGTDLSGLSPIGQ